MDELGRGTSTFDGYALAYAVLNHIYKYNQSRIMFTTHYHWLVDDFKNRLGIQLYSMQFDHVQHQDENDDSSSRQRIRFLYSFQQGICKQSFGVNVAELAGMPLAVLNKAKEVSRGFNIQIEIIKNRIKRKQILD